MLHIGYRAFKLLIGYPYLICGSLLAQKHVLVLANEYMISTTIVLSLSFKLFQGHHVLDVVHNFPQVFDDALEMKIVVLSQTMFLSQTRGRFSCVIFLVYLLLTFDWVGTVVDVSWKSFMTFGCYGSLLTSVFLLSIGWFFYCVV